MTISNLRSGADIARICLKAQCFITLRVIGGYHFALILGFNSLSAKHTDILGVQVTWVTGPWFLSIFINMLPWESGQVLYNILVLSLRYTYNNKQTLFTSSLL
jgi:hypothetical protein